MAVGSSGGEVLHLDQSIFRIVCVLAEFSSERGLLDCPRRCRHINRLVDLAVRRGGELMQDIAT